jgi:hypothetical protein
MAHVQSMSIFVAKSWSCLLHFFCILFRLFLSPFPHRPTDTPWALVIFRYLFYTDTDIKLLDKTWPFQFFFTQEGDIILSSSACSSA